MLHHDLLCLASGSPVRQRILREMKIPFVAVGHTSDEQVDVPPHNFDRYVLHIAQDKMRCAKMPSVAQHNSPRLFVLAADSLVYVDAPQGRQVLGKPKDLDDARRMLRLMGAYPAVAMTACALALYQARDDEWHLASEALWTGSAVVEFVVPEEDFAVYHAHTPNALEVASGCTLEGFGQRYIKSLQGDYTAALGLPARQLYMQLKSIGFVFP